MSPFKNSILIITFNYSHCIGLKKFLYDLYIPYFKKIIFYSDIPINSSDTDIHFIDIHRGFYVHRIFEHFYSTYVDQILESYGVFYTMDDNIINVTKLWQYSSEKIIYPFLTQKSLDNYSGWHWDQPHGKRAINNLLSDPIFRENSATLFTGAFADYFYLPTCYWTPKLITLFSLYGKYNVFLELAIPSIIAEIEKDSAKYSTYSETILWNADRNKTKDYSFIESVLKRDLFLHPLKFKTQPEATGWLQHLFKRNRKCVVITTINPPTKQIDYYSTQPGWDLIIVGDSKTPSELYKSTRCIYLGLEQQKQLFPTIYDMIPMRSYTRKMFGYLYAIKNGYRVIYDTDDDNQTLIPLDSYGVVSPYQPIKKTSEPGFVNLYSCYTKEYIWPRGIPPDHPSIRAPITLEDVSTSSIEPDVAVIQGLVNNDPDVDAHYRLNINSGKFVFEHDPGFDIVLSPMSVCPFNTQNTYWITPDMFHLMYLPTTVTFRYTDILRGFVSLQQLWRHSKTIRFTGPTAYQERNEHDLHKDYESEVPMYKTAEQVVELIHKNPSLSLIEFYEILSTYNIVRPEEITILKEWMRLCEEFIAHE